MEELIMKKAGIIVNSICTLKCKLCVTYTPYEQKPQNYPINDLQNTMDRYFQIVSYVDKFSFAASEPLLHPDLHQLVDHIGRYKEQVGTLELITNGSVMPSSKFLDAARAFGKKFFVLIDNYGPDLSTRVYDIEKCLSEYGIRYTTRNYTKEDPHCGGWVDFGDLTEKKFLTESEMEAVYAKCAYPQKLHFCFSIQEGKMYPCSPCRRCKLLGIVDQYDEYIDFFDDTLSTAQQRQKIRNIYQRKSLSACAYCSGLCDDSVRFTPAEQLTAEEQKCVRAGARFYSHVQAMMNNTK